MTVGRTLWLLIILKLLVLFAVLKPFFFPNQLDKAATSAHEKGIHVANELISRTPDRAEHTRPAARPQAGSFPGGNPQ